VALRGARPPGRRHRRGLIAAGVERGTRLGVYLPNTVDDQLPRSSAGKIDKLVLATEGRVRLATASAGRRPRAERRSDPA
jgi:hypothetical protein